LAEVRAAAIKDSESFEAWLEQQPENYVNKFACAIASRCAMRVLPWVGSSLYQPFENAAIFNTFRCLIAMSWSAKIDFALSGYKLIPTGSNLITSCVPSNFNFVVTQPYERVDGIKSTMFAVRTFCESVTFAKHTIEQAERILNDTNWRSIRFDAEFLETEKNSETLSNYSLWTEIPFGYEAKFELLKDRLEKYYKLENWTIWFEWYENVCQGKPAFTAVGDQAKALERRIALGDGRPDFWDRTPAEVNAEIKSWVDAAREVREPETDFEIEPQNQLGDEDFNSRPASLETKVQEGVVVLAHQEPLLDLPVNSAEAATADLAKGLEKMAEEAASAQADPRIVAFLNNAAGTIKNAIYDQEKLFESGRNQKALSSYSETVSAEWNPLLAAHYHGLVVQFAQVLNHFEAWREFIAKPISAAEPIVPSELATQAEEIEKALNQHKSAFAEKVLFKLNTLTTAFRLAVNRMQFDDPSNPMQLQTLEAMQSDLAVSIYNVLLSYLQRGFYRFGGNFLDGSGRALDIFSDKAGYVVVFLPLGLAVRYLIKKYPDLYGTVVKAMKSLKQLWKDTEPN
jgi:hypothetical protein